MTDREKLAREMSDAYREEKMHHGIGYDAWLASADIALAYAEKRVAELKDPLELILPMAKAYAAANPKGSNWDIIFSAEDALSPAREGGGDE